MTPGPAFELRLNGRTARAADISRRSDLPSTLEALGLPQGQPALAVVGGADRLAPADMRRLRRLFLDAIVPVIEELGAAVVTGGTDAGVMRLLGLGHHDLQASFPLVGVAAVGTVRVPGRSQDGRDLARLEPHHTHFVLVPGSSWGDESWWLAAVTTWLARGARSATLVVNGGGITYGDVQQSLKAGRRVLVVAGTGRTADQLAGAIRGKDTDGRAGALVASAPDLLRAVDFGAPSQGPGLLVALRNALS